MRTLVTDLIAKPGAHREQDVSVDMDVQMDAATITKPATGTVRLDAGVRDIMASGKLAYEAELVCVRCLTKFVAAGQAKFSQMYAQDPQSEDVLEVDGEGTIDLDGPIRDEVVLSLNLTPICREDCAGLCATCGSDLNSDPCQGHEDEITSPFAILAQLLDPDS